MKKVQTIQIEILGQYLPIKVYHEDRKGTRFSIGAKHIILRFPYWLPEANQKSDFIKFKIWLEESFANNEKLRDKYFGKSYQDGDTLKVGNRFYTLRFEYVDAKNHKARIHNGTIYFQLCQDAAKGSIKQSIRKMLSRLIAADFKPEIARRVNEFNNMHFRMPVKSLNFKYNQTNWGSCSNKGNLNLSTRLLFAPDDVVDYVIIHELAHLIELNHSEKFWKLVSNAMPNYEEKEEWLKENGHLCHF